MGYPKTTIREGRPVSFGLKKLRARQIYDKPVSFEIHRHKCLKLLAMNGASHWRKPMRIPDTSPFLRPLPNRGRQGIGIFFVHPVSGRPTARESVVDI